MLWFPVGRKALSKYKMNFEKTKKESGEKKIQQLRNAISVGNGLK